MKLSKDRDAIHYNDFLTLAGIPREAFDYRLGNRSALEWVIDQYRVSRDEQGNIIERPEPSRTTSNTLPACRPGDHR